VALPLDVVLESLAKSVGLKPLIYHIYGTISGEKKKPEPDWPLVKIDFNGKPFREVWGLLFDIYGAKYGIDYIYIPPDTVLVAPVHVLNAYKAKQKRNEDFIVERYKIEAPPNTYLVTKKDKTDGIEVITTTIELEKAKSWFKEEFLKYLEKEVGPITTNWLLLQEQEEKVYMTPDGPVAVNPAVILFSVYGTSEQQKKIKKYLAAAGIKIKNLTESAGKIHYIRRFYQVTYLDPEKTVKILKREYPDAAISFIPGQKILIVHAAKETHNEISNFLAKIDIPPVEGPPIHQRTFKLSNARAIDVVAILNNLFGASEKGQQTTVSSSTVEQKITGDRAVMKEQTVIGEKEAEGKKFPKFAADPRTNSIIAIGTAEDLEKIASIIQKLDVKNKQIKLAIRIQSIDSSIFRKLGFNWQSLSGGNLLMSVVDGALSLIFDSTRSLAALNITATLDALEEQNLSHKLSDVTIITEDNLGYNQPYNKDNKDQKSDASDSSKNQAEAPPSAFISAGGQIIIPVGDTLQPFRYGLLLSVSPRVTEDNEIIIDLTSIMGSAPTNGPQESIIIPEHSIHTRLRVKNKETIVLSGIIRDEKSKTYRKVPFLGDIPLIGPLFSSRSSTNSHSELLIVITPEILEDAK